MERNSESGKITKTENTNHQRPIDKDTLNVYFIITLNCNANCSYCYWKYEKDKRENVTHDFKKVRDFLAVQLTEYKKIKFIIYGGEPSVHPLLPYLIYSLFNDYRNFDIDIYMTTNLLKPLEYWDFIKQYKRLHVTATYHSEQVENEIIWFFQALQLGIKNIVLMKHKDNTEQIFKIYDYYSRWFDNIKIRPIEQEEKAEYGSWKNWICYPGYVIRENGDLMYCWSDMKYDNFKIYNIYNDPIKKLSPFRICPHSTCYCPEPRYRIKLSEL